MFGGRHIRATLIRRVRNPTSTTERFRRIRPVVSAPTGRLNVQTMASHPTFGVEEEFLLADPTTGEPVAENKAVAAHAAEHGVKLQLELSSCQVETTSEVVGGSDALRKELTRLRSIAAEAAKANGAQLLAAALPPTRQHDFPITDTPRYREIADINIQRRPAGCHQILIADFQLTISQAFGDFADQLFLVTESPRDFPDAMCESFRVRTERRVPFIDSLFV